MYTGLEKVAKPKHIKVTLDVSEGHSTNEELAFTLRHLADTIEDTSLVVGLIGNVAGNGQIVGQWSVV